MTTRPQSKSVDAVTIETHGYGITNKTWSLIEKAYKETGIIVFTDPDHAGLRIRKRIMDRFPDAREAFLDRGDAEKDGDIGIENASPQSIRDALARAHCSIEDSDGQQEFTIDDMVAAGLVGQADSAFRRQEAGRMLGIGYSNGKSFLQKLNKFGITKEELYKAIREI